MTIIMTIMTHMETIMTSIINNVAVSGFLAGILSSAFVWWLVQLLTKPRLLISDTIVLNKNGVGGYRIKIQNGSHFRDIYNINIHTVYCTAREGYHREELVTVAYLRRKPWIKPERVIQKDKPYEMKIRLMGPKTEEQEYKSLETFLSEKPSKETRNRAFLDVIIICSDKYTGTAKQILSHRYFAEDVRDDAHFVEGRIKVEDDDKDNGEQF